MTSNRSKQDKFVPEALTQAEVSSRDAAAEGLRQRMQEGSVDFDQLEEAFPEADMAFVKKIVLRHAPYEDVTEELVGEILAVTHTDNYEVNPWREAVLSVLASEFMANLKASSAQLVEDAVGRVTRKLGESYRGSTKNACQTISGQRTRLRKTMRTLVLASLYLMKYKKGYSIDQIQDDVMSLVQDNADDSWYRRFKLFRNVTVRQLQNEMMALVKSEELKKEREDLAKVKAEKKEKEALARSEALKKEYDVLERKSSEDNSIQLDSFQNDVISLVKNVPSVGSLRFKQSGNDVMVLVSADDYVSDDFPFEGFLGEDGLSNARGRCAFCEATKFIRAMLPHMDELDQMIQKSSKRWRIERMALIDLNILRMATYELFIEKKSSTNILINEAVELAKMFGAEQSPAFVNGILQQICNDNANNAR
ncbi:MAG: transcription antitermination factor NusB [Proteobacteria bacterium]|nr:transcription antitermination factor NusB [Pseudomonadota bacterium]